MSPSELLDVASQNVVETAAYLFAYDFVLVLAPVAHLALVGLAPERRGWLGARRGAVAGLVLGLTEPLSRAAFERNLRRLPTPGGAAVYLGVSHALTAYAWVLLGPLLGKDFLLSHALGVVVFLVLAAGMARLADVPLESRPASPDRRLEEAARSWELEPLRYVGLAGLGLALGGLVAAWGLSPRASAPAEIGDGDWWTQVSNGGIGLGLALLGVPPVANLFVGTYLWKIGLGHAGIVAFFCAAPAAPTRWGLYSRLYGPRASARLVAALLAAALMAGLLTAWAFGALDLSIRYKLLPEQLWEAA